jgi:hypothetical protein
MTFNYAAAADYSYRKVSPARVGRPAIVAFARRQRRFASHWKSFPLSVRSAHGCAWAMSASTAMTLGACTRTTAIRDAVAYGSPIDHSYTDTWTIG